MSFDRTRARRAFAAYAAHYNADDPKVALKISHTYRVAALCERIARSLAMDEAEIDLAWLCGLLHDIGRFEQLRRYGTFNDAESIDHAACSAEVLFEQGHIRDFTENGQEYDVLRTAIRWHSAYRLPDGLDKRTERFCHLLRDADKIDILRVNVEVPLEDIYSVSTQELRGSAVTPAVLDAFYARHCVLRSLKRTPVDNVVGHASLVYELVYPESLRIAAEQGWLWKLLDFSSHNPETAAAFAAMRLSMQEWLADALQNGKKSVQ